MMRSASALALACLALCAAAPAQALPDVDHSERALFSLSGGVGGPIDVNRRTAGVDHDQGAGWVGLANEGALTVALAFAYPLLRYAAIGAEVQYLNWATREEYLQGYPRFRALDFSILPRLQLPITDRIRLIASVPLGLSVDFIGALERDGFREQGGTGDGYNLALRLGAAGGLFAYFGVMAELELSWHWFDHTWTYVATDGRPFMQGSEAVSYATTTFLLRVTAYLPLP
jgi:hypothetical protein